MGKITKEIDQKRVKLTDGIAKTIYWTGNQRFPSSRNLQKTNFISKNPVEWTDV